MLFQNENVKHGIFKVKVVDIKVYILSKFVICVF